MPIISQARQQADFLQALQIVWLILGLLSGLVVAAPFLLPSSFLFGLFPVCEAKAAGGSCILCGMTTAFVYLGSGDVARASSAHGASVALFVLLVLNFAGAFTYTIMRAYRHANS